MNYDNDRNIGMTRENGQLPETVTPKFEAYFKAMEESGPVRKKQRKNSALPMFAAFLAGAIVIGSLTYAADRNNLFTGGNSEISSSIGGKVGNGSAGQGAGLTTASFDTNEDIAAIYEEASPAVVKIENYSKQQSGMMNDPWFQQFFGYDMRGRGGAAETPESGGELMLSGSGTGFFFDKEGYILTNEHVISGASEVKVTVQGQDEPLTAEVLGTNADLDLAVLKVASPDGSDFPALTLGDSDDIRIGDWVIAIGNPYGFDQTLTMGVLSAKERPITIADEQGGEHTFEHLLQTDASINPGNSGGPLLNEDGEVIGINTAVNAEAQGIGFAIPTSTILEVLEGLKSDTL